MKTKVFLFFILISLISCTKESDELNTALQQTAVPQTPIQNVLKRGVFNPTSGIQVMGVVKLVQVGTDIKLQLDSFSISPGPDLKVYLSKTATPGNHVNLGNLQASSGTQFYVIPSGVNLSDYQYALIHCQQYNHLFSYANLQ